MTGRALQKMIRARWKARSRESHKGDYGRVFILAGSRNFSGAPHLTAAGALYSGAGLVTLGVPRSIYEIAASREAEVMVRPFQDTRSGSFSLSSLKSILEFCESQDVLALGPGISQNVETQKLVRRLVTEIKIPLILDADGLNALGGNKALLKRCRAGVVVTPHAAEFNRLFKLASPSGTESQRKKRALSASKDSGAVVVLKGHHTVVASPTGKAAVNPTGNPGMATGGTGDVLTGMIAALAGQGFNLFDASVFAVYIHGLAGDLAARKFGQVGLSAKAIIHFLPQAYFETLGW